MKQETTLCFTGYRTSKIIRTNNSPNLIEGISINLEKTIQSFYNQGYNTFISGMSEGFDMLAAEVVIKLRVKHPEIKLILAIPFMGQESTYSQQDKNRYDFIYKSANDTLFSSNTYHNRAFLDRNDYMLERSSAIICYYDGQSGGTMYTYNRAVKRNMIIVNLCV